MKFNNKGFATSAIMYIILIMCIILITVTLSILGSRKLVLDKLKEKTLEYIYDETKINIPSSPELISGLTPVVYNGTSWVVADTEDEWYDYKNREWANAVILKGGLEKSIGDIVNISSEVQGMFVWIPRYEYKIEGTYGKYLDGTSGTQALPGEIKVNFIFKSKNKASDGYIIHPAFKFGDENLSGIWVGKFETTGNFDNPTILPNVISLRSQNVSTQFITSQKFNNFIKNGDSHMAKNSEWGAVAYLSQSKYGKYGNLNYSGADKEVAINNCSNYITGIGGDTVSAPASSETCTTNTYETQKGQAASTTGNITGVYDMSGGAYEYVMGVYNNSIGRSEFSTLPETKYYDNYTTTNILSACNSGICYGHALSETSGWYGDYLHFVSSGAPWFLRGGYFGDTSSAGVFYFTYHYGSDGKNYSFRVVIAPSL